MGDGDRSILPSAEPVAESTRLPSSAVAPGVRSAGLDISGRRVVRALQRSDPRTTADIVTRLQQDHGNAAVGRLIARAKHDDAARLPPDRRLLQRTEYDEGKFLNRPGVDIGDTGPGVKLLQRLLGVKESGVFDHATRTAADGFQRQQGWSPSGVGAMTWEALERHEGAIGRRPNLNAGDRGPGVKLLQRILGVPQTSVFDQPTRKAVDAFQRNQGWPPSGVGPMTWKALDDLVVPTIEFELEADSDGGEPGMINVNLSPDPRKSVRNIDNRAESVAWGMANGVMSGQPGSFLVYCRGLDYPILLPWHYTSFDTSPRSPVGRDATYGSREEALAAVAAAETAGIVDRGVGWYPAAGGMLAPTIFTPSTAPQIMATAKAAVDVAVREIQNQLVIVAASLVLGVLGRYGMKWANRVGKDGGPSTPLRASPPTTQRAPGTEPPTASTTKPPSTEPPTASTTKPPSTEPPTASTTKPPNSERTPGAVAPKSSAQNSVTVSLIKPPPTGAGASYGKTLGDRLKAGGVTGPRALKPIAADLNTQTGMTPADKAGAAAAAVDVSKPTFGAGPVVEMDGHFVVTSRVAFADAPVMVVKPNGTVTFGKVDIVQNEDFTWTLTNLRVE